MIRSGPARVLCKGAPLGRDATAAALGRQLPSRRAERRGAPHWAPLGTTHGALRCGDVRPAASITTPSDRGPRGQGAPASPRCERRGQRSECREVGGGELRRPPPWRAPPQWAPTPALVMGCACARRRCMRNGQQDGVLKSGATTLCAVRLDTRSGIVIPEPYSCGARIGASTETANSVGLIPNGRCQAKLSELPLTNVVHIWANPILSILDRP